MLTHASTCPPGHRDFLDRAVERLAADPRVVGVAAAGSYADNSMDEFSDLDLVIAVEPEHFTAILSERQRIAAALGNLLAAFTGEHVGEPRLLICLYDTPLLHVDLKFVAIDDADKRVDDPLILWERDSRLTAILSASAGRYPQPDPQWIEDRFWVWIHYVAAKIGRGEGFDALAMLSFLRGSVIGPLGLWAQGQRPAGVRRVEMLAPDFAAELKLTLGAHNPQSLIAATRGCIAVYRRLRAAGKTAVQLRSTAEAAATAYLAEIETRQGEAS